MVTITNTLLTKFHEVKLTASDVRLGLSKIKHHNIMREIVVDF